MGVETEWGLTISGVTRGNVDSFAHDYGGATLPLGVTGYL